jgi:hypothetical protein
MSKEFYFLCLHILNNFSVILSDWCVVLSIEVQSKKLPYNIMMSTVLFRLFGIHGFCIKTKVYFSSNYIIHSKSYQKTWPSLFQSPKNPKKVTIGEPNNFSELAKFNKGS